MLSTSRTRGSGRGPDGSPRSQVIVPMSERQQLALVMQISSEEAPPAAPISPSPPEVKKRSKSNSSDWSESSQQMASARGEHSHAKKHSEPPEGGNVDNVRATHVSRARDDSGKKGGNASGHSDSNKRSNMEGLAQGEHFDGKETTTQDKCSADSRDGKNSEGVQLSSGVVSSTQDESSGATKKPYCDENAEVEAAEDEVSKRKKRKENDDKEPMAKPAPVARGGPGRVLTGIKPPGPASKTGVSPLGKASQSSGKSMSSGKGLQAQGKGSGAAKGKSSGGSKSTAQSSKQDRKSPVASPKPNAGKDTADADADEPKSEAAPKVPPLKIVIPGGAGGSGNRNEQEGGSGQRGGGKGRGSVSTLPYVIPCTSNDTGQTSDSSDGNCDDKRPGEGGKAGQRVLRSHRTNDGDKDKERTSPHTGSDGRSGQSHSALSSNKSPTPSGSNQDADHPTTSGGGGRSESNTSVELHPRKRKIKASKDSHSRDNSKNESAADSSSASHNITHSNPYQMYIHIRKQIDKRQKGLFPVKPKPPKDFNKYLMNRCTYTLQSTVNPEPQIEIPVNLPPQMVNEFTTQEKERTRLRIQHLVEKEKLVLAVEQEILRVHGRAERAVANQALPFSVCTMLRDNEVYNVLAPEQEEKRNAQRSRCNGRQINSWLQEVDDKWEKIKVGMLRRQHTEAETLHAVQMMGWEWKLKELGICDYKTTPKIDPAHVPQIHVSNFDLPA